MTFGATFGRVFSPTFQPKSQASDAWLPTDIAGCLLWFDFSDVSTMFIDAGTTNVSNDGDLIYQANDKSGNANHLIQSTEARRASYKTAIQNGLSASLFGPSVAKGYTQGSYSSQNKTIIVACKPTIGHVVGIHKNQSIRVVGSSYYSGNVEASPYITAPLIYPAIITTQFHSSNGIIRTNGVLRNTGNNYYNTTSSFMVGAYFVIYNGMVGHIFEILMYASLLGDIDIGLIESYLNNKWAIYA